MIERIVMLGAPGSGKGTWSKFLSDRFSLPHISSGDLFRRELEGEGPLAREIRPYVEQGDLVPDDITIRLVRKAIVEGEGCRGFILDGFPRTMVQARALDRILAEEGQAVDAVINIEVSEPVIIQRTLSRFVCKDCGQPYNATTMQPLTKDVCDRCGGRIVRRVDDTAETLKHRLEAYQAQTAPLTGYYRKQGKLVVFPNDGPPDDQARRDLLLLLDQSQGRDREAGLMNGNETRLAGRP